MECWPVSDGSRVGDACSTWGVRATPVGWQRCLMQSPQWPNRALDDGHYCPNGLSAVAGWGACDSVPDRLWSPG